jgi:hypothetical protein
VRAPRLKPAAPGDEDYDFRTGEKQKRRPKIKDKRQSERFKEVARELGADKSSDAFDRIVEEKRWRTRGG